MPHGDRMDVEPDEGGGASAPRRVLRGLGALPALVSDVHRLKAANETLEERVARLEEQLAQERRLQRRVAELTDIVMQVLLPADQRDDAEVKERLDRYAQGL